MQQTSLDRAAIEAKIAQLEAKRDEWHDRLDVGAAKIEEHRGYGKNVTDWENYWLKLLREYEGFEDQIRALYRQLDNDDNQHLRLTYH